MSGGGKRQDAEAERKVRQKLLRTYFHGKSGRDKEGEVGGKRGWQIGLVSIACCDIALRETITKAGRRRERWNRVTAKKLLQLFKSAGGLTCWVRVWQSCVVCEPWAFS